MFHSMFSDNLEFFSRTSHDDVNIQPTRNTSNNYFDISVDSITDKKFDLSKKISDRKRRVFAESLTLICREILMEAEFDSSVFGSDKFLQIIQTILDRGFSDELLEIFRVDANRIDHAANFDGRVCCYSIWRAICNGRFKIHRWDDVCEVIMAEFAQFGRELRRMVYVNDSQKYKRDGSFDFRASDTSYSREVVLAREAIEQAKARTKYRRESDIPQFVNELQGGKVDGGIYLFRVQSSFSAMRRMKNMIDILITDPPYGFNVNNKKQEINYRTELTSLVCDSIIQSLKKGGQAVLALPQSAMNGRQIGFTQTHAVFIRKFISMSRERGRNGIRHVDTFPYAKYIFLPPYYWNSTRALSRSILHFVFD